MIRESRRRSSWAVWTAAAVLLPMLYVLSIGPATEAWRRESISHSLYDRGYEPVQKLAAMTRSGWLLARYTSLWLSDARAEWDEDGKVMGFVVEP